MAANPSVEKGTAAAPSGVCGTAIRSSVARTRRAFGGTAVAASTVTSTTNGLSNYAGGVECNLPAIP
jgi:hypothetical protein